MLVIQQPLAAFQLCLLYSSFWLPSSFAFYTAAFGCLPALLATQQPMAFCAKFDHFLTGWFQFYITFFKNEYLGHYLHSYVFKIKSKHFLRFLMPWSQRERRIATILRYFAPNLIIFEPLVSAYYKFFSKTNTWGIISIYLSLNQIKTNSSFSYVLVTA